MDFLLVALRNQHISRKGSKMIKFDSSSAFNLESKLWEEEDCRLEKQNWGRLKKERLKRKIEKKSYRLKKKDWHRNRILGRVVRETKINRTSECLYLVMEKTRKSKRTPKFLTWATSLKLLPVTKKGWWSRMCVFIWGEDSELKYHWEFHNRNPFPERS